MFAIAWQCLTGRYVATDFSDREKAEWPPHPDRVFQALAAAWGERGRDPEEERALQWLETLGAPDLAALDPEDMPAAVKTYVPVNDIEASPRETAKGAYGEKLIALLPAERSRKERYFPYSRVGDAVHALVWQDAAAGEHREALARLAAAVIRIGHSSSLVRCWISEEGFEPTYQPAGPKSLGGVMLRVPERGRLAALKDCHARAEEERRYIPPPAARQTRYRRAHRDAGAPAGAFSDRLVVFAQSGGRRFTLLQTLDLAAAFRGLLIPLAESVGPAARALVSGHAADGAPLAAAHLAYLPLAHVGHEHADGHLLGMALALPAGLYPETEEGFYAAVAAALDENGELALTLGRKGEMRLKLLDERTVPRALRAETWCRAAAEWASATPIVLDRMAKAGGRDLESWAAARIAEACRRQGLPEPVAVEVSAVPFLSGAGACFRRASSRGAAVSSVAAADQFPLLVKKDGSSNWMFHARLRFAAPIRGPLVLGAGRYRGYGLCKPFESARGGEESC